MADPNDRLLLNNLVVALAYSGRLDEAAAESARLTAPTKTGDSDCTSVATRGLIAFRSGQIEEGRKSYRLAFDNVSGSLKLQVFAHWLKEEARVAPRVALPIIDRLHAIAEKRKDLIVQRVLAIAKVEALDRLSRVPAGRMAHDLAVVERALDNVETEKLPPINTPNAIT